MTCLFAVLCVLLQGIYVFSKGKTALNVHVNLTQYTLEWKKKSKKQWKIYKLINSSIILSGDFSCNDNFLWGGSLIFLFHSELANEVQHVLKYVHICLQFVRACYKLRHTMHHVLLIMEILQNQLSSSKQYPPWLIQNPNVIFHYSGQVCN